MGLGDVAAAERLDVEAVSGDGGAFLADGLALARGEVGQEPVEVPVITVLPVELLAGALQETVPAQALPFVFRREGDMQR